MRFYAIPLPLLLNVREALVEQLANCTIIKESTIPYQTSTLPLIAFLPLKGLILSMTEQSSLLNELPGVNPAFALM